MIEPEYNKEYYKDHLVDNFRCINEHFFNRYNTFPRVTLSTKHHDNMKYNCEKCKKNNSKCLKKNV